MLDLTSSYSSTPSALFPRIFTSFAIEGNYIITCNEIIDTFEIIAGNLASTFFIDVEIEAISFETDEVVVTARDSFTKEILFQLTGKISMITQDGKVILNGTRSGRLGEPDGADIIVKAENLMYSLN